MRFKFVFEQTVSGTEICEAIIEGETKEEVFEKFYNRDFRTYLIMKQDFERVLSPDTNPKVEIVREVD